MPLAYVPPTLNTQPLAPLPSPPLDLTKLLYAETLLLATLVLLNTPMLQISVLAPILKGSLQTPLLCAVSPTILDGKLLPRLLVLQLDRLVNVLGNPLTQLLTQLTFMPTTLGRFRLLVVSFAATPL